jgi:hypothetical protein
MENPNRLVDLPREVKEDKKIILAILNKVVSNTNCMG